MANLIGQQFGNYRLISLLGSGGFAEVYLGSHVRLGMQAAIKVLHARLVGEDSAAFQEEAHTIAELIHPHIIRVLDFDLQDGTPFLVLDYAPNGSLRQRHRRGEQVPLEQIVSYVNQVAEALQYAHDRKHVHRDVKPENMLVGRQNEILLTDFGIASIAHSTSSMNTEAPLGTLAYMSPEQLQGHARPASDQYALGVTVYQWLTGVMPFRGSSAEVIGQHLSAVPATPRSLVPEISPEVEQVVMTALAKNPRARFASVQEFATALERVSQGQVVDASTFSYTAQTVAVSEPILPPVVAAPHLVDAAFHTAETVQASGAAAALTGGTATSARTSLPSQTMTGQSSYLQPALRYVPPQVQNEPDLGKAVLVQWVILSVCLLLVGLGVSVLTGRGVLITSLLLFFGWSIWGTSRAGMVRVGVFASLLACIPFLPELLLLRVGIPSFDVLIVVGGSVVCAVLGGMIGRGVYRSRQPIHPPAGGTRL